MSGYKIWDSKLHCQVGKDYSNKKRARTRAEKLNLEYGAHRYAVVIV